MGILVRPASIVATSLLAMLSHPAFAAVEGRGVDQFLTSSRTDRPIFLDGRLDEEAWSRATPTDDFTQQFPNDGAKPSFRTTVRVLFDDDRLYVGIRCDDPQPELVVRRLARRDALPEESDWVGVGLDSAHSHNAARVFAVNAAGVLFDAIKYDDNRMSSDWDGVWDAATIVDRSGWSAELVLPLSLFRFADTPKQIWGFMTVRHVGRTNEVVLSTPISRASKGDVSLWGHLVVPARITPRTDVKLVPYVAARVTRLSSGSEGPIGFPTADVGLDARVALTSRLSLSGALNPDFGQVEADNVVLNLSTFETFFPEKRPFFTEGMELFQPALPSGGGDEGPPQVLFYSRRIGLSTPILAAAKVTGEAASGVQIGLLDVFTLQGRNPGPDGSTRLSFHPEQPLRLAPDRLFPTTPGPPTNTFVARVRGTLPGGSSTIGAIATAATPIAAPCTDAAPKSPSCSSQGGNVLGADWNLHTADQKYGFVGQLEGSQVVSGPPSRTLRDGTVLRPGDKGVGTLFRVGKTGGDPLRAWLTYQGESPRLELNASGYLRSQNHQRVGSHLEYIRPNGVGPLHELQVQLNTWNKWSTDGRATNLGSGAEANVFALLPGFHFVVFGVGAEPPAFIVREVVGGAHHLPGSGAAVESPGAAFAFCFAGTDKRRAVSVEGGAFGGMPTTFTPTPIGNGLGGNVSLLVRGGERSETQLGLSWGTRPWAARFVDLDPAVPERYVFAALRSHDVSVTLRQQVVLTPRITLQGYAQVFSAHGLYGPYFEVRDPGPQPTLRLRDMKAASYDGPRPDFYASALNLNLVFRWEYSPGSTFYAVYTRAQELFEPTGRGIFPPKLGGDASDVLLLKWSYFWDPV